MVYKFICLFSFFSCLTVFVSGQATITKLSFNLLDRNNNQITDLKTSDIQIAGVKDFSLNIRAEKPLEIMIMIDASASQERTIPFEKKVAQTFINDFLQAGKDKIAIVSFTGEISLEQDLTDNFQNAQSRVEKITFVPPKGYIGGGIVSGSVSSKQTIAGSTSIWESLNKILETFSNIPDNNAQRAIILISDGVNNFGKTKINSAVELSIKTKIPIYAIGIGDNSYDGVDKSSLKRITQETGGISVIPKQNSRNLSGDLKPIEKLLRTSYELSFSRVLSNPIDEKIQEVEIKIVNPELNKQKLRIVQAKGFFNSN